MNHWQWHPIQTALKNGEPVCVAGKDGKWWFRQARWDDSQDAWVCDTTDQILTPEYWTVLPDPLQISLKNRLKW